MSRYYVREIERDWQPIEAENVEAAAERYVAKYAEPAEGSNYWIDLVVRGPEGEFFPPQRWGSDRRDPFAAPGEKRRAGRLERRVIARTPANGSKIAGHPR